MRHTPDIRLCITGRGRFLDWVVSVLNMADVIVTLTPDEALVLFDLLHRWEDSGIDPVLMPGEQAALWALSCLLESTLAEPFDRDYAELVNQARQRLAERGGA
jgi:hypothetical protein